MYLLDDLWNGNVTPSERFVRKNSQYKQLSNEANDCMEQLTAELPTKSAELLERFLDKNMALCAISEEDAFIRGVRIGAQFMLDVMGKYESQFYLPYES